MIARRSPMIVPRSTFGRQSGAGRSKTPKQTPQTPLFGTWTFQRNSQPCRQILLATARRDSYSARQAASQYHHTTSFAITCIPRFSLSNNRGQGFTAFGAFVNPCSKCGRYLAPRARFELATLRLTAGGYKPLSAAFGVAYEPYRCLSCP